MNVDDFVADAYLRLGSSWAKSECLAAMSAAGTVSAETVGRIAHIRSCTEALARTHLLQQGQSMPVWPSSTKDDCTALARAEQLRHGKTICGGWRLVSPSDLEEYREQQRRFPVQLRPAILTHVLFHSTYHRGQIALQMLTRLEWSPLTLVGTMRSAMVALEVGLSAPNGMLRIRGIAEQKMDRGAIWRVWLPLLGGLWAVGWVFR